MNESELTDETPGAVYVALRSQVEREVEMDFADGRQVIPDYVVASLGGREKVEALAKLLAETTYAEFIADYYESQEVLTLNRLDAAFRRSALRGGFTL